MVRAIYSGSFDPVTFGHLDIIARAARAFDELSVVVGNNPAKRYVFSLEERVALLRHCIENSRVFVRSIQNQLLADYAYESATSIVVKGVRDIKDYDYERMMHEINITQQRGIDTHVLMARRELAHVSSSATKELCRYQGFTHEYVPLRVKQALEARLNDQVLIGVTGGIACGKSHVARALVHEGNARGMSVHDIDLDQIAHEILLDRPEPVYAHLRATICEKFVLGELVRKKLGDIVFEDEAKREQLNAMMRTPLLTRLRSAMVGKTGIILINSALLAEAKLLHLCNNHVLVVGASDSVRWSRLGARGHSKEQIERRLSSQFTNDEKLARIEATLAEARFGRRWTLASETPLSSEVLGGLLEDFRALGRPSTETLHHA